MREPMEVAAAGRRGVWARGVATVAMLLMLLWLSIAITTAMVLGDRDPRQALRWWPWSGTALATRAATLLGRELKPATLASARRDAIAALRREPVSVVAVRTLGLTEAVAGRTVRAGRLFDAAEALSRRDLPTQLWLIESRVTAGDVGGALVHYDLAMRANPASRETLLPVLASAAADRAVARPLARLLAGRPLWWPDYFRQLLYTPSSSPLALASAARALRLRPPVDQERVLLASALVKLAEQGAATEALALYVRARPSRSAGLVRPLRRTDEEALAPFEWDMAAEPDLEAIREDVAAARGPAMILRASAGREGEVARQLLVLPPGGHTLSFRAGNMGSDAASAPSVALVCVPSGAILATLPLPPSLPSGRSLALPFRVPAAGGCEAQRISIVARSSIDSLNDTAPWIGAFAIERR